MKILLVSLFVPLIIAQTLTHSATLAWTDTVNPSGTMYNVWRESGACPATPPTTTSGFTQLNTTSIQAKTYVDSSVIGGATYCYIVTAVSGSNQSGPSNDAQGAIPSLFPPQTLTIPLVQ